MLLVTDQLLSHSQPEATHHQEHEIILTALHEEHPQAMAFWGEENLQTLTMSDMSKPLHHFNEK